MVASGRTSILEQIKAHAAKLDLPRSALGPGGAPLRVLALLGVPVKVGRRALAELVVLRRFGHALTVVAPSGVRASRGLAVGCLFHDPSEDMPERFLDEVDVIVAVLDRGRVARSALGLQEDLVSRALLEGLWRGMTVYADMSCAVEPEGPAPLRSIYEGHARTLEGFGVRRVWPGSYIQALSGREEAREDIVQTTSAHAPRLIVTSRDVQGRAPGTRWDLPHDAIVTDAAMAKAREMGVELSRPGP